MGNYNSNNSNNVIPEIDRSQRLLNGRVNDPDISLLVNDQPQIKKIFAIKNPVYLKRNTICLERDSSNRNLYYLQFEYDAIVDLNINVYFNAVRNNKKLNQEERKGKKENSNSEGSYLQKNNNITSINNIETLNYIPGKNFVDKIINFSNCPRGQNVRFFDKMLCIDANNYEANKDSTDENYDIVIEFMPIFREESSLDKENEILFYTLCRLTSDENSYKIRPEMQRLKSQSMWFDIHEVFNSALESGECLICCSNVRNTLFLPCKHSCTCQSCAHSLRMRNNPCPICKNSI